MLIVRNNIIPFKGYKAVNLFGILFCRKDAEMDAVTINHESIHTRQILEMLILPYYIWYGIEWVIRRWKYGSWHKAYRNIAFEQEAYHFQNEGWYLKCRRHYYWWKFYNS
jgi:hypothetical protein